MKKQSISLLSTTFLVLVLASCGTSTTSMTSTNSQSNGTTDPTVKPDVLPAVFEKFEGEIEHNVEIKVLENGNADKVGYSDALCDAFNEEYAEYGITAVDANIGEYNDLAQMGPYGTGPDVLYQANDIIMGYVDDRLVTPLPTYYLDAYKQIPATAWKAYESDATGTNYTFGIPINVQTGLLYYRQDLLPENWQSDWDDNENDVPDMVENLNDLYRFSKIRHEANPEEYGFVFSLNDFYFTGSFLFTYGGYIFGDDNTDDTDIGLHQGDAAIGANIARDFAGVMSVECIDDSAKLSISGNMASGKYFASVTTPDNYEVIISAMALEYQNEGKGTAEECDALARENLMSVPFPDFPISGDLEDDSEGFTPALTMGGINGFAISSYTKYPKASLAFINFAASYEMVEKRFEMLGIAPCREDVATIAGDLSKQLFEKVDSGAIYLMPSLSSLGQVWSPAGSFFSDLAEDNLTRSVEERKYDTIEKIQQGLETTSQNIYDAIHILGA